MRSLKFWGVLYTDSRKGRITAFAALSAVVAVLLHFFSGPPPLSTLTVLEGRVEQPKVDNSFKSSYTVWLTPRGKDQTVTEAQYFVNRGDSTGESLKKLNGQLVKAWIESDYIKTIYQLEVDGRRVIDYDVRRDQLSGNPTTITIYFIIATAIFLATTISLLRGRKGA